MKAMLLESIADFSALPAPLNLRSVPDPEPAAGKVVLRVTRCGVCHTELDEIEGRTAPPRLPVIPGHQVIGVVEAGADRGRRVGVAWIASACGHCRPCLAGDENLCGEFRATGRDVHGGYAEFMEARAEFVHPIPDLLSDSEAAPLLCAGAVGYRALKLCGVGKGRALGLMGFGASNHLVLKMARYRHPGTDIFVFSRSAAEREFALSLGAAWAGTVDQMPPVELDAVIDATPAWNPVVAALKCLRPGGRLVINAIRKEVADRAALMQLDYPAHLWMEKELKTVANVTRRDVREFLQLAAMAAIKPEYQEYDLQDANRALLEMKQGRIRGAKVLRVAD
ncbi:MAG: alcohol dehydrogenase catalytic domain-containing protein [Gammaproteobacteria bacterium]|nr:alcohol dehydrogenase catalytic domain-containing protein [Gammaproteobacteria bacterium]